MPYNVPLSTIKSARGQDPSFPPVKLCRTVSVPDGVMHGGKKLRVGDITVDGTAIATGGQVARYITMTLYGLAVAGAPHQQPKVCQLSPCPNKDHPDYVDGVDYGTPCPDTGAAAAESATTASRPTDQAMSRRVFGRRSATLPWLHVAGVTESCPGVTESGAAPLVGGRSPRIA